MVSKSVGLENGQSKSVVGFLCLSAKVDFLHPNQKESVRDLVGSAAIGRMQACDLASQAAPAFWPR